MRGGSVTASSCAAVDAASGAQKTSGSRRAISVKGKRARPAAEVTSLKATKVRRSFATSSSSLAAHSLLGRCDLSATAHGSKEGNEEPQDSVSVAAGQQVKSMQFFLGQRIGVTSTLKRGKPLRRGGASSVTKRQQTTLILQPIKTGTYQGNALDSSAISLCSNERHPPSLTSCDGKPSSGLCLVPKPSVNVHEQEEQSTGEIKNNSSDGSLRRNNNVDRPKQEETKGKGPSSNALTRNEQGAVTMDSMAERHNNVATVLLGSNVMMREGVQRRQSLRSHLLGGRKRYDDALTVCGNPDGNTGSTDTTACTARDVNLSTGGLGNSTTMHPSRTTTRSGQQCSTTPAGASSSVVTGSTRDSSSDPRFEMHHGRAPAHVYAKDRTPMAAGSKGLGDADLMCSSSQLCYNGWVAIPSDRMVLEKRNYASSLRADTAAYGQCWFTYHKKSEHRFQPWQMSMTGKIEKLRLGVIAMYWNSATLHPISPATIYVAINNFGRLLHHWSKAELEHPSAARWALAAVIAFRLAFKAEERPEIMYEVTNVWNIFPMFQEWDIDRSAETLNKTELEALRTLDDSMDVPLGPMFLALYINAAGWPEDVAKDYHELGLYLLALTTFASTKDHFLRNVMPSRLAVAALILAVKIINGDRACARGLLHHLPACPYPAYIVQNNGKSGVEAASCHCICRYEFYPERLKSYTGLAFEELAPVVKGLSALLRSKPTETCILSRFFPLWANNDWQ